MTLPSCITRISHACEDEFLFVENAAREIAGYSGRCVIPSLASIIKTVAVQQAIDMVTKEFAHIDVQINCLGNAIRQPLVRLPDSEGTSISDEYLKGIIDV